MPHETEGSSCAHTFPFAPPAAQPINVHASYIDADGATKTTISRIWKPGDAVRCRRCPPGQCTATVADDGSCESCQVTAHGFVSLEDAASFRGGRVVGDGLGVIPDGRRSRTMA